MSFSKLEDDVISKGLCTRCGVCSGVCPVQVIGLDSALYPVLDGKCTDCKLCTRSCPGADIDFPELSRDIFESKIESGDLVGSFKKHYVSHPVDEKIRSQGASGGLVTGLLVHLLEKEVIQGAIVVGSDPDVPYRPKGILATTRKQIEASAQSKYCITPSMEALRLLRKAKGKFAVVALPCQIQGLRKLAKADPKLFSKIYAIFGLYCNCTLEPNGHIEAISACNIELKDVAGFSFRDHGWPGGFCVKKRDGEKVPLHTINIKNVMNVMFRIFGAERCYLCVDALAEYADISFGDFWSFDYKDEFAELQRCTLATVRTERGDEVLKQAVADSAVISRELPVNRFSKRILNMSRGKKSRATVRLFDNKKKDLPIPDYHLQFPTPTSRERMGELMYKFFFFFRGEKGRRFVLKVLFSRAGVILDRINVTRKNIFCKYHGN